MSSRKPQIGPNDVVDMELHCVACGTRLYVPALQAEVVITSLERTGAVILICICGQAQLIQSKGQKRHD